MPREGKVGFRRDETLLWNTPADPADPLDPADPADRPDPPEVVSGSAAQTPSPHAPGVRMTVVNKLPQMTK